MKSSKKTGFTILELLVVVAVIGLLAVIILYAINTARAKSRDARRIQDITEIHKAIELYMADHSGNAPDLNNPDCLALNSDLACTAENITTAGKANWAILEMQLSKYIPKLTYDPLAMVPDSSRFIAYAQIDPGEDPDARPCEIFAEPCDDQTPPAIESFDDQYTYVYRAPSALVPNSAHPAALTSSSYQIYVEQLETKQDQRFGFGLDL